MLNSFLRRNIPNSSKMASKGRKLPIQASYSIFRYFGEVGTRAEDQSTIEQSAKYKYQEENESLEKLDKNFIAKANLKSQIRYKSEHLPDFALQNPESIPHTTEFGAMIANFESFIVWTPRIQKTQPSEEFLEYLEDEKIDWEKELNYLKVKNSNGFGEKLVLSEEEKLLVQNMDRGVGKRLSQMQRAEIYRHRARKLTKAFVEEIVSQNPDFTYIEDFECVPSKKVDVHGTVDFLIFDKNDELNYNFPMLAVYVPQIIYDSVNDVMRFDMDMSPVAAISQWMVTTKISYFEHDKTFRARAKENRFLDVSQVIMSTGHMWQLFETDSEFEVRRSHKYKPSSLGKLSNEDKVMFGNPQGEITDRKIWNDYSMVEIALGLLKHGLSKPSPGEE